MASNKQNRMMKELQSSLGPYWTSATRDDVSESPAKKTRLQGEDPIDAVDLFGVNNTNNMQTPIIEEILGSDEEISLSDTVPIVEEANDDDDDVEFMGFHAPERPFGIWTQAHAPFYMQELFPGAHRFLRWSGPVIIEIHD